MPHYLHICLGTLFIEKWEVAMQSFAHNSRDNQGCNAIEVSNEKRGYAKPSSSAAERVETTTLARTLLELPWNDAQRALQRSTGVLVELDSIPGDQDQERLTIVEGNQQISLRFHQYGEVFRREGLYETILRGVDEHTVSSVADALAETLKTEGDHILQDGVRHLDFGAGTGRMPDAVMARLADHFPDTPVHAVVGLDIAPEAKEAALRDRPGLYDAYVVGDLLSESVNDVVDTLRDLKFNVLTVGSAVGFGDIPFEALWRAVSVVDDGGICSFNANTRYQPYVEEQLERLSDDGAIEVLSYQPSYRHRNDFCGGSIMYSGTIFRRTGVIPESLWRESQA